MHSKLTSAAALTLSLALPITCATIAAPAAADTAFTRNGTHAEQNGRDLYRAIFFGDGPEVGRFVNVFEDESYKQLAATNDANDENSKEYSEFVSSLVGEIQDRNAGFFDDFGKAVTSGDPYKVEKAVTAAEEATKESAPQLAPADNGGVQGQCFALVVWSAAAAVNYAGFVNIETLAFVHHKFKLAKRVSGSSGGYSKDKLVADITKAAS